jgi:hypothetical protein
MKTTAKPKPKRTMTPEQQRQLQFVELVASLGKPPGKTPPPTYCNASTTGSYSDKALTQPPARPLANKALTVPSRVGPQLRHLGGLVTTLAGKRIPPTQGTPA